MPNDLFQLREKLLVGVRASLHEPAPQFGFRVSGKLLEFQGPLEKIPERGDGIGYSLFEIKRQGGDAS